MRRILTSLLVLSAAFLVMGCSLTPPAVQSSARQPPPVMTPELRVALKLAYGNVDWWESQLADDRGPARSIDTSLRAVGAKLASDGKMYDRQGKEIYLWCDGPVGGMVRSTEELARIHKESQLALEEARRRYTVVEIPYCGPQPP